MCRKQACPRINCNHIKTMLILVKGRWHVQARLVEPVAESINNGDSYILVTKSEVFNYIGKYSNIIEKTRAVEIASSIQEKDLGCQAIEVITINDDKLTCSRNQVEKFWSYLGVVDNEKLYIVDAGHPDEDELYESAIIDTNMVFELKDEQLVSHEKFWGTLPKIEMLDKNKYAVLELPADDADDFESIEYYAVPACTAWLENISIKMSKISGKQATFAGACKWPDDESKLSNYLEKKRSQQILGLHIKM
ncbi:supervillin-like [Temnothorax longispinosus]|uniref:supervillin-like n=1 Tax=Temnothorax longispinosus TaxID=300112 RepID=UPI003A98F0DD